MTETAIVSHTENTICRIRMNRPEKQNALTLPMYADLADAFGRADQDPGVHAILIGGTSACFSAGNDLQDFLGDFDFAPNNPVHRFLTTLPFVKKPVIAAVEGPAVGIGSTLLLHCDLVFASETAEFRMPFVHFGLIPEFGSSFLLPRLCGHPRAAECLLLGESFGAERALELGMINRICHPGNAFEQALEAAQKIAALPTDAVCSTKAFLKSELLEALEARIHEEADRFVAALKSADTRQRIRTRIEALAGKAPSRGT